MPSARRPVARRLGEYFAVDSDWQRPLEPIARQDVWVGVTATVVSLVSIELSRGMGYFEHVGTPRWLEWLIVALACGLLVIRRRFPLAAGAGAALHLFVVGVTVPTLMGHASMQVVYFVAFYSAVAYARDRRTMAVVMGLVVTLMFGWLAWQFAVGNAVAQLQRELGDTRPQGPLSPVASSVVLTLLINAVYFGGAAVMGQVAWRGARQREALAEQAATIAEQSADLQRRAVVDERLRIARELHDVVAHHVAVIGIQAAAGRKMLDRDTAATRGALTEIERSSRDAVTQMRDLLGTLRSAAEEPPSGEGNRSPQPGPDSLPDLVAVHATPTLATTYDVVANPPDAVDRLPGPVALTLVRTAQEALANVSRHSTATRVAVVLRVEETAEGGYAEVEVIDDGRPRAGTSGSGLGQLGIRERAASQRGVVEIGPRVAGGYRVRVRLPLPAPCRAPRGASRGSARSGGEAVAVDASRGVSAGRSPGSSEGPA